MTFGSFFLSASQYRILLQGCWYELFGGDPDDFPTEMDTRREQELNQPLLGEESLIVRRSSSYQSLASDDSPAHAAAHLPLFLPGRILYITEDGPTRRWAHKCMLTLKHTMQRPLEFFWTLIGKLICRIIIMLHSLRVRTDNRDHKLSRKVFTMQLFLAINHFSFL